MKKTWLLIGLSISTFAFGWGEYGHHLAGRVAAKSARQWLTFHPEVKSTLSETELKALYHFMDTLGYRAIHQGHVSNIPDIHWRNLGGGLDKDGQAVADNTHFLDPENFLNVKQPADIFQIPLSYETAKAKFADKVSSKGAFFHVAGTLPWRAQQFSTLLSDELADYPTTEKPCVESDKRPVHPTMAVLAYAGLLSHKIADASQPYHTTADYNGVATGQHGIHSFFETRLLDALDPELEPAVLSRTIDFLNPENPKSYSGSVASLRASATKAYGSVEDKDAITALTLALISDSYSELPNVRALDEKYAVTSLREALKISSCSDERKPYELKLAEAKSEAEREKILSAKVLGDPTKKSLGPCRRLPTTRVNEFGEADTNGKTVAFWHKEMIVNRIAVASALLTDIWIQIYLKSKKPSLCQTYKYALNPALVSPLDPGCAGYALHEEASDFKKSATEGVSVFFGKKTKSRLKCLAH